MKVCHLSENEDIIEGGIKTAIRNQRRALDLAGVDYTLDPKEDHDILHLNVLGPRSMRHIRRAKRLGRKVVAHAHTTGEDFRESLPLSNLLAPGVDRYARRVYGAADLVIAPSDYTADLLRSKGLETPIEVVTNGIDASRLEGWESFTGDGWQPTRDFVVLDLGLVFERKGLRDFLAAAERLPDADFVWFGPRLHRLLTPGSTRRLLKGAPPNAHFPGFVEDIRDAFALADVFFWPSLEENQGISLLEAAWCGLPLVVRDIPTYEGWLQDDVDCLKGRTVDDFVAHLSALRDDPSLRKRLGEGARAMARTHSLEHVGERLRKSYNLVLD